LPIAETKLGLNRAGVWLMGVIVYAGGGGCQVEGERTSTIVKPCSPFRRHPGRGHREWWAPSGRRSCRKWRCLQRFDRKSAMRLFWEIPVNSDSRDLLYSIPLILLAYSLHPLALLYALTLADGTLITRLAWVLKNMVSPVEGGVVGRQITLVRLLHSANIP